ncbi:ATP-binding protein [Rhizobium phaseoli]|uniref:ATP-binding protein n=1 Tax=Rhizobium phaseoli TaxID=396 RepID=UPI000BBA6739|nr:ATP-binding protein [Rhizobium phaseoli]PCD67620.1 ATP-binding protein [Rhizobium phaseoli]
MSKPTSAEPTLASRIETSAQTKSAVEGNLKTNDRVIARVTDGIYREPWSAFREMISNAYDADATRVSINCDYPFFREIRIADNGNGMNEKIVGDLLENIGGSSKRTARGKDLGTVNKNDPTRSLAGRKLIGKIGIGLFAVAQLTQQFQIITKRKGESKRVSATIHLNTYLEDSLVTDDAEEDYVSGHYSVISEETPDIEAHGTTIILTGIRPAVREKLQSQEIWTAIDDNSMDDGSGLIDAVFPPAYNIGRLDEEGKLLELPNLPWEPQDAPHDKFRKLVDAAVSTAKSSREQANLSHFDNYLKMIWRVSVGSPIAYIEQHPFDLRTSDGVDIFELSNKKRGAAKPVTVSSTIRDHFALKAGSLDPLPFTVSIDSIELKRPIVLAKELLSESHINHPSIFIGKVETDFGGATKERSGGRLAFEAYLYWNTRIVPKENIGAIVRVNNASGTLFDPEFLGYQVSEQTRKKQITCEIFVHEGLDGAINIDRESFNTSSPHYLYLQRWLHSAFRQFATMNKRLGREAKPPRLPVPIFDYRSIDDIWTKMRGAGTAPPPVMRPSATEAPSNFTIGGLQVSLAPNSTATVSTKSHLVDAVSLVLDAHGVLELLSDEGRAELIFDLVSILERAE